MPIYEDGMDLDALQPQFLGDGRTSNIDNWRQLRLDKVCTESAGKVKFVWTSIRLRCLDQKNFS